jgi:hypothetical protein
MAVRSLPRAVSRKGLLLPLRTGATFSFVDPDLIYGTTNAAPLTIGSYRNKASVLTACRAIGSRTMRALRSKKVARMRFFARNAL